MNTYSCHLTLKNVWGVAWCSNMIGWPKFLSPPSIEMAKTRGQTGDECAWGINLQLVDHPKQTVPSCSSFMLELMIIELQQNCQLLSAAHDGGHVLQWGDWPREPGHYEVTCTHTQEQILKPRIHQKAQLCKSSDAAAVRKWKSTLIVSPKPESNLNMAGTLQLHWVRRQVCIAKRGLTENVSEKRVCVCWRWPNLTLDWGHVSL